MRKVTHAGPEDESGIDLTPLIDCVFIMLIFFIVTASFVKETGVTPMFSIRRPRHDVKFHSAEMTVHFSGLKVIVKNASKNGCNQIVSRSLNPHFSSQDFGDRL